METEAWPEWEQTDYNWFNYGGYPGVAYSPPSSPGYAGWGPVSIFNIDQFPEQVAYLPDEELYYLKGCVLYGPNVITDCTKEYKYRFGFLGGDITNIIVDGPAVLIEPKVKEPENIPKSIREGENSYHSRTWKEEYRYFEFNKYPPDIVIKPDPNIAPNSTIEITVHTKLVQNEMLYDGYCSKTIDVSCCDCARAGGYPTIYGSGGTIDRGTSIDVYVDSDGLACPPFSWSISGSGLHFNNITGPITAETTYDGEIIQIWADNDACGSAEIIVTDYCGVEDSGYIRVKTFGTWNETDSCGSIEGDCCWVSHVEDNWKRTEKWCIACPPGDTCGSGGGNVCMDWICSATALYRDEVDVSDHPACPDDGVVCDCDGWKTYQWDCP